MKMKLLNVENSPTQARGIAATLRQIPEAVLSRHGITELAMDFAASESGALRLLERGRQPYDVVLLDLGLPFKDGGPEEDPTRGQNVLRQGMKHGAIRSALVISAFHEPNDVLDAFRGGAVNFLFKDYTDSELIDQVLACWSRRTELLSNEALMERLKSLLRYAEAGSSYSLGIIFTDCVREVLRECEDLENEIANRQGLDRERDAGDPLFAGLARVRDATQRHSQNWQDKTAPWPVSGEKQALELATELAAVRQHVEPCLVTKQVQVIWPEVETIRVNSFGHEARRVLEEMFLGALVDLPDGMQVEPSPFQVRVSAGADSGLATVTLEDSLPPMDAGTAVRVNQGQSADGVEKFSRGWGLSIMQQVALRGGGRLEIQKQSGGNRITYHLPLA